MPVHKFEPREEQRRMVKALAGYGVKQRQIASLVGLGSPSTLRKHFHEELALGPVEAKANVMRTLFKMASSGRNPSMTIFWLKTRARWSETGNQDEAFKPDGPHQWVVRVYQPPPSSEQQQALESAVEDVQEASEWEEATPT
jgi:hypothetical protein